MIKRISCTANKNINGRPNGLADYREGVKERLTIYGGKGLRDFKIIEDVEFEFEVEVGAKVERLQIKVKLQ